MDQRLLAPLAAPGAQRARNVRIHFRPGLLRGHHLLRAHPHRAVVAVEDHQQAPWQRRSYRLSAGESGLMTPQASPLPLARTPDGRLCVAAEPAGCLSCSAHMLSSRRAGLQSARRQDLEKCAPGRCVCSSCSMSRRRHSANAQAATGQRHRPRSFTHSRVPGGHLLGKCDQHSTACTH